MFSSRSAITAIALALGATTALAAPGPIETIYDGNGSPVAQGWSSYGDGTQIPGDGTTEFITTNDGNTPSSQAYVFDYETGASDYIASLRLKVVSSSYNLYDAALTLSPFGNGGYLSLNSRSNNFMIGNGIVLWGNEEGGSVALNTSVFHDYQFRYNNGQLDLYIDASFADILAGTATAALSRTLAPSPGSGRAGYLEWGDITNDRNYDSHYIVDSVQFQRIQAITPVPEPSSYLLLGTGLALCMARYRRGRRA